MWGTFVESEISAATKKCKTDAEAERKVNLVMTRIFREKSSDDKPAPVSRGQFRDPAAVASKAKG